MNTSLTMYRPGLLGSRAFEDVFDNIFNSSFDGMLRKSTQGYPVADIYSEENGDTVMEFALAGFTKEELSIEVKPGDKSIVVRADAGNTEDSRSRRIARRSFEKRFVNYNNNLDLAAVTASFENGLLRVVVPTRPETKPLEVKIN
mgnify:FL=1